MNNAELSRLYYTFNEKCHKDFFKFVTTSTLKMCQLNMFKIHQSYLSYIYFSSYPSSQPISSFPTPFLSFVPLFFSSCTSFPSSFLLILSFLPIFPYSYFLFFLILHSSHPPTPISSSLSPSFSSSFLSSSLSPSFSPSFLSSSLSPSFSPSFLSSSLYPSFSPSFLSSSLYPSFSPSF